MKERKRLRLAGAFFVAMILVGSAANADVGVRQGRHGDTGRLVFDFTGVETFHTQRVGDMLTIQFIPAQPMASMPVNVPGVRTLQGGDGFVRLCLAKGAVPHVFRIGDRIVVDARQARVHTPAGLKEVQPANIASTTKIPNAPLVAMNSATLTASPTVARPSVVNVPAVSPRVVNPPAVSASLPPVSAAPLAMPALLSNAVTPLPEVIDFTTQPGAAALRRGNEAILVFDTAEIPDISALQSTPAFANAALVSLQDAQIITLPLAASESLVVTPVSSGWQVAVNGAISNALAPALSQTTKIEFPMPSANKTVTISDPVTGSDLLVGTVTQSGAAANFMQSGPGFSVLPAWLGVAVLPEADNLGLSITPSGFELSSAAPGGLPLGTVPEPSADASDATPFGQGLNLPNGNTAALRDRMLSDLHETATLPPLGRLTAQIALAADMIALGLGPEANGVLATAVLENPAALDNGQIAGLRAVAGVLSRKYHPNDFKASGIVPSSELAFWKAAGLMEQGKTLQAAPALAQNLAVFEVYPAALRNGIDAEIAETLVDADQLQAAQQLIDSDPINPALDLARAKLLERQGKAKAALGAYRALARSNDFRISAIAADRAVELALAAGQIGAGQAADALDAALFDWRDAEHERHMRLRIAQLRAQAGQWPQAFTMLQSALTRFPDHQAEVNAARSALFVNMLSSNEFAQLSPIQAVAILQQNQDLIPAGASSANIINLLAQRLDELDLPGAAAPMLNHLIQTIPPGVARATLGAQLAQVDWDAGSPVSVLADLAQTAADGLPPGLAAQRAILNAKAQAAGGNAVAAVGNLAPGGLSAASPSAASPSAASLAPASADPATLETQAQIAEQTGQWPQAEQALGALVRQFVPASGGISGNPENLLLRLATAASHDNDSPMLSSLASQYSSRVASDPAGQMFQTLTAPALTGDQGLNQALKEIAQLQALPAMVDAVSGTPVTGQGKSPTQ